MSAEPCCNPRMLIGYMRVSTTDQSTDLQRDALIAAGVHPDHLYADKASGKRDDRPGLDACLKALRVGDILVVWKLDRLGRSLRHLVATVQTLVERGVGFKVLTGQGANIDTATASGKLVFGIFAALAEFERELISERTRAGLAAARARGRKGGRKSKLSATTVAGVRARLTAEPLLDKAALARELGVHRATLWRALERTP
jgi:DNA invertase Pin-like site-specific DNA recombinase